MVKAATFHPLALAGLGFALITAGGTAQAQTPAPADTGPLPHDLSPWGMFSHADPVVQTVMIGLALASVATWTVWLAKTIELYRARQRVRTLLNGLDGTRSLSEAIRLAEGRSGPEAFLIRAAMAEAKLSAGMPGEGLKERVAAKLERVEAAAGRRMTMGTGILATIGSVAPFVGLFGTVWGIMNSFVGISKSQTTNLAVVAPGIAEALLATALGLVAAIPAVVIYNAFARSVSGYKALLGDAAAEVLRLVSRDMDRRALPLREAAE
ncbi:tonB-system energizer ExbB [Magnetospirillum molischianum]|uniref:Biopolymer transport protein ExbB n=1 Tax=Magnetospirillum molischianum DSM 120 TaxID=1150626 RepID=H8FXI2_MAGML|nr:tonB-system energizer ExbB [Magnetospirillum molischianum]CCG43070.1 biopolymer transport protein ExbB; uptake of enterobactin, tonB-dependent uptake of B colicins [Magnetospirillum molischianum DSM 120]